MIWVTFWSVIKCLSSHYGDQLAKKNKILFCLFFAKKKYGSKNSSYTFWSSYVISLDMIDAVFKMCNKVFKKINSLRESKKYKNGRLPLLKKHRSPKSSYDLMKRHIIPRDMKRAALLMCNKVLYIRISSRESKK